MVPQGKGAWIRMDQRLPTSTLTARLLVEGWEGLRSQLVTCRVGSWYMVIKICWHFMNSDQDLLAFHDVKSEFRR